MVTYPDLTSLTNSSGIGGLMSLPNSSFPYFWAWIMGGLWAIMVLTMYFKDKEKTGRANILSIMAVSCLAIIFLSTLGTIIGIISQRIIIDILVLSAIIIAVWFFSSK